MWGLVRRLDLILHVIGFAVDDDGLGLVQQAVQNRRSDAGVVVEDRRPLLERLVGGEDDRAALVALADDLAEQIGAGLVEREIPNLVQDQGRRRQIPFEFGLEPMGGLGGDQIVDGVDGGGEDHRVPLLAGGVT